MPDSYIRDSVALANIAPPSQGDAFDSYDDDLIWILDKLVGRTGAVFGVVARYQMDENLPVVLARSESMPCRSEKFLNEVTQAARGAVSFDRRRREDTANIMQCSLETVSDEGTQASWRMMCLSFQPAQSVCLVAAVCCGGDTQFSGPQLMIASTLYPVLTRYIRLWWLHRMERRRANALGIALDLSDLGVILLDRRGELIFGNTQATALLDRADGLRRNDRSITAADFGDGACCQAAIQHAIYGNLLRKSQTLERRRAPILSLRRRDSKRSLIASVMSIDRVAIDPQDPAVIIYVLDPEQDVQRLLVPVCHIYKLTAAEARLVGHLVSGASLSEAAGKMKIQKQTARAYLKHVFAKTQTNRQADLVRVMFSSLLHTNSRLDLALV